MSQMSESSQSRRRLAALTSVLVLGAEVMVGGIGAGCAPVTTVAPVLGNPAPLTPTEGLLAGVADVDITPPARLPKAGYSENGQNSAGFRTRLHARAFFLKADQGEPIVVVQTDLLAGSSVVHRLVASKVAAKTNIRPQNLAMVATHTHAGPGNYLGSNFYNRFASNRAGFDPDLAEFLAERIATAVTKAWETRRPARMAVGKTEIYGLTRNRSLLPYLRNTTVSDKRPEAQTKFEAINPALYLVRIDAEDTDGKYKPLGAFSSFSIHGTAVPQSEEAYNADVWAYIAHEVEWKIEETWHPSWKPIHGPFEGTHGDAAPAIRPHMAGYIEARRLGTAIGDRAFELLKSLDDKLTSSVTLKSGFREVDMFTQRTAGDVSVCARPFVGGALIGGAYENTTPVLHNIIPFAPGLPRWLFQSGCHGQKRVVLSRVLQPLILPTQDFPHVLPMQLLQLDSMLLMALPYEITTESGRRIENAVRAGWEKNGKSIAHVAVSSVANEYYGYATTPEEYSRQHYEGGHTLYGPNTVPYLMARSQELAQDLASKGSVAELMPNRSFELKTTHFMPEKTTGSVERKGLSTPEFKDPTANAEGYWHFFWQDVPPDRIAWDQPLVKVEVSTDGKEWRELSRQGRPVNDGGYDVGVYYRGASGTGARYEARWYNPEFDGGKTFMRFVVAPREQNPALLSPIFR